jgi:agmatine deiminase
MPAEWEPQAAIWLSWPHNLETWPTNLADAQTEFADLVETIAESQQIFVMVGSAHRRAAEKTIEEISNVELVDIPTNDAWARDYAPTFVKDDSNDSLAAVDWIYNAWGEKYPPFDQDQKVGKRVAEFLGIELVPVEFCFEGGAIEINESGLMISTTTCALNPNRNPDSSLVKIESLMRDLLGAQKFVWLSQETIEGDDTDGHIDQLARFTDDSTIVHAWSNDENDPMLPKMRQNLQDMDLQLLANHSQAIRRVALPNPHPIHYCDRRIPASYCNFLITNELVIVPQFGVDEDQQAVEILKPLFSNRKVIGLPSLNLAVGLGSFHCLSQQQPV